MRVISGKFKGHKLNIPKNFLIRPTTDRFKESLFSIIHSAKYSNNIDGKYFLDLCSGSGGIGIEAFSRGAKKVYMIDKNQHAINLIKKNLSKIEVNIELGKNLFVLKQDITKIKKLQFPDRPAWMRLKSTDFAKKPKNLPSKTKRRKRKSKSGTIWTPWFTNAKSNFRILAIRHLQT